MKLMSVLSPSTLGLLAGLGVLFALDLIALADYRKLEQTEDELHHREQVLAAWQPLPKIVLEIQADMSSYLLTGDRALLASYRTASENLAADTANLLQVIGEDAQQRAQAEKIGLLTGKWLTGHVSPLMVKRSTREGDEQAIGMMVQQLKGSPGELLGKQILHDLDQALWSEQARIEQTHGDLEKERARVARWMHARAAILLIVLATLALMLARTVSRLIGTRGMLADQVQNRERIERAVRENEAVIHAMSDASPLGILITDAAGACTYVNLAFERITGVPESAIRKDGWQATLHPDDRARVLEAWNQAMAKQATFSSQHRFLHRNGKVTWVAMKAARTVAGEQLIGFVFMTEDVTALRETEAALCTSQERLNLALERSHLVLFDWHVPSGEMFLSPQWGAIVGDKREPVTTTARRFSELVHPEDVERMRKAADAAITGEHPVYQAQYRVQTMSGEWKWAYCNGQVTERDSVGRAIRLTGTITTDNPAKPPSP